MLTKFTIIENYKTQGEEKKTNYLNRLIKIIRTDIKNQKSTERGGPTT